MSVDNGFPGPSSGARRGSGRLAVLATTLVEGALFPRAQGSPPSPTDARQAARGGLKTGVSRSFGFSEP